MGTMCLSCSLLMCIFSFLSPPHMQSHRCKYVCVMSGMTEFCLSQIWTQDFSQLFFCRIHIELRLDCSPMLLKGGLMMMSSRSHWAVEKIMHYTVSLLRCIHSCYIFKIVYWWRLFNGTVAKMTRSVPSGKYWMFNSSLQQDKQFCSVWLG